MINSPPHSSEQRASLILNPDTTQKLQRHFKHSHQMISYPTNELEVLTDRPSFVLATPKAATVPLFSLESP